VTAPLFVGQHVIELEKVDSTNAHASAILAEKRLPEGTAIVTKFQLLGQGYGGNSWQSEAGKNLLMSVIFYPTFLEPRHQFFLNQMTSLAVANTIESFLPGEEVRIKWPNDVITDDKKIAGILIANSIQGQHFQHAIIGIGVNVNQENFEKPLSKATSMLKIAGKEFLVYDVRLELFSQLEKRFLQLRQQRIEILQKDYMKKLYRVEEESVYKAGSKRFNAKIVGLSADGKLILQTGSKHEVFGFKEVEMIY
jgi:BirA family transcriptional regulator, biotin operon repressor / biotin---[acetyl-CoA-carboxylase] ligase